ncbi:putative glycosidase CRH2 [Mycoemilia scoparia]|uniref:Glycosidase CRH2 n=1 Tax=Mycoemilia scoparia TaxID=417184 RepID=A0A9W8DTA4_9FUNG|nr:putative glycosidase CRH2 [Mycoemilia scoparia]
MYLRSIFVLASSWLLATVDAGCKNYGTGDSNCPADLPCCSLDGKCGSGAFYCLAGSCDAANSFSTSSCYSAPSCQTGKDTFGNILALSPKSKYIGDPNLAAWVSEPTSQAEIRDGYLNLILNSTGGESKVSSTRWIKYGAVTARVRSASSGKGVVSQFVIKDQNGNEIDFNWVGTNPRHVQANYNYKKQLTSIPAVNSPDLGDTTQAFHDYTISWDQDSITWAVDGMSFRTLNRLDTESIGDNDYKFPSTESQIVFRVWDGGSSSDPQTQKWAGSPTNFADGASYTMSVYSVTITCDPSNGSSNYTLPPDVAAYEKAHNITSDNFSLTADPDNARREGNSGGSSNVSIIPGDSSASRLASFSTIPSLFALSVAIAASHLY